MQRAQQPSIKTHFGKNQGGAARHAGTVRAVRDRLRLASTIAGVQQAGEELARASLPSGLGHRRLTYAALMRIDERLSHAKNDLLALCEKLLGELEPSTPRAPNAENVPPSGAPRAVPQRSPSKSPLRPANGGTPAPAPSEDESDGDEGPAPAPAPAPIAAPAKPTKRKRGRPKDEDASAAVVVRSRGREPSLLLIWVDLVRAAAAEFVLAQPARMESDELRRRGRREFEGVAGFTIGPESAELHQRLSRELRRVRNSVESRHARASIVGRGAPTQALREKIKTARRALADVASSNQLVLPLLARERLVDYLKRVSRVRRAQKAPKRVKRTDALEKLLHGREPVTLERALEAWEFVHVSYVAIRQTAVRMKPKMARSTIGDVLRHLDVAKRLYSFGLLQEAQGPLTLSHDEGSMSAKEAGTKVKMLSVTASFAVLACKAPTVLVARYGSEAEQKAARDALRMPSRFGLKPPPPKITGGGYFSFAAQKKYKPSPDLDGPERRRMRAELCIVAGKDWANLKGLRKRRWIAKTDAKNADRAKARREYEADLAAARRDAELLYRLRQARFHRMPEHPPVPSPAELYLSAVAAQPAFMTTQQRCDAALEAMRDASAAIKAGCVEEVSRRAGRRWAAVRPLVPPHLRASGDASLAGGGDSFASCRRRAAVTLSDADADECRRLLGLPPAGAPLAPPAPRDLDLESFRAIFPATATGKHARARPLVVEPPEPERLVPAAVAVPGAVVRPRRPAVQPRRFRED